MRSRDDLERAGKIAVRTKLAELEDSLKLATAELDEGRSPRRALLRHRAKLDELLQQLGARVRMT